MKAIETCYKGYRFRSRLEARWAVFFDALGATWEYEKEGYELPSGRYLPDFWLPDLNLWVEVKGVSPTGTERQILRDLVEATGANGTFRVGEPARNYAEDTGDDFEILTPGGGEDTSYLFCTCPWCHRVGFEFDGRGARVCGFRKHYASEDAALEAIKHLGHRRADDKCYTGGGERIVAAATKARGARFEHGEAP